jgi:thiamine-monophosphate kinase
MSISSGRIHSTVHPLTEDELIASMVDALGAPPRTLRVGIGDDAAAWKANPHHLSLLTTDMLVDGVHFRLAETSARALGHKALAENLSDIAAMGGAPTVAVIALGLTLQLDEAWVRELYGGLAALARSVRCAIAGGDIVRTPALTLGVTVAGEVRPSRLRTRAGARPGDIAAITGPLGMAAAGLKMIGAPRADTIDAAMLETLSAAYFTPQARVREGQFFGTRPSVHALMDISDGLSTDAARMARASDVDLVLDAAALAPSGPVAAAAEALGVDAMDLVINGGDDYELLAAIEPRPFRHVAAAFAKRFGRPLTPIGRFEPGAGHVWLERLGKREAVEPAGYDHLRRIKP